MHCLRNYWQNQTSADARGPCLQRSYPAMLPSAQLQSSWGVAVPCFWLGLWQRAAQASTALGNGGYRGSPGGQAGQGRASPPAGSRAAGDSWVQPRIQSIGHLCGAKVKPESQLTGQDQGCPWLSTAVVALETQHHSLDGGLKAWAEMGSTGRGLVPGEAGQGQ